MNHLDSCHLGIIYVLNHKFTYLSLYNKMWSNIALLSISCLPGKFGFLLHNCWCFQFPVHERCLSWSQLSSRFITVSIVIMAPITQQRKPYGRWSHLERIYQQHNAYRFLSHFSALFVSDLILNFDRCMRVCLFSVDNVATQWCNVLGENEGRNEDPWSIFIISY